MMIKKSTYTLSKIFWPRLLKVNKYKEALLKPVIQNKFNFNENEIKTHLSFKHGR